MLLHHGLGELSKEPRESGKVAERGGSAAGRRMTLPSSLSAEIVQALIGTAFEYMQTLLAFLLPPAFSSRAEGWECENRRLTSIFVNATCLMNKKFPWLVST